MRIVGLTSVDVTPAQVGELAARRLVERIERPDRRRRTTLLNPTLEIRGSTGPVRGAPRAV